MLGRCRQVLVIHPLSKDWGHKVPVMECSAYIRPDCCMQTHHTLHQALTSVKKNSGTGVTNVFGHRDCAGGHMPLPSRKIPRLLVGIQDVAAT